MHVSQPEYMVLNSLLRTHFSSIYCIAYYNVSHDHYILEITNRVLNSLLQLQFSTVNMIRDDKFSTVKVELSKVIIIILLLLLKCILTILALFFFSFAIFTEEVVSQEHLLSNWLDKLYNDQKVR